MKQNTILPLLIMSAMGAFGQDTYLINDEKYYGTQIFNQNSELVISSKKRDIDITSLEKDKLYYARVFFNEVDSHIKFIKRRRK